jgi:phosphohistidine phosphatase
MTLTLILMRHAKSDWANPLMTDHDRPLNARGQRAARAMGDWLRQGGWQPDEALVSTSERTRETWAGLGITAPVRFDSALYLAEPEDMWRVLHGAKGSCVLMLGHNPGIADFAANLVAAPPDHDRFADYPTCATLIARFDAPGWDAVRPFTGQVVDFAVPRQFTD